MAISTCLLAFNLIDVDVSTDGKTLSQIYNSLLPFGCWANKNMAKMYGQEI